MNSLTPNPSLLQSLVNHRRRETWNQPTVTNLVTLLAYFLQTVLREKYQDKILLFFTQIEVHNPSFQLRKIKNSDFEHIKNFQKYIL